jgi:hypothetical protein
MPKFQVEPDHPLPVPFQGGAVVWLWIKATQATLAPGSPSVI